MAIGGWQQRLAELALPRFREVWPDFCVGDVPLDVDPATGFPLPAGIA
jgi:hypothetical protein